MVWVSTLFFMMRKGWVITTYLLNIQFCSTMAAEILSRCKRTIIIYPSYRQILCHLRQCSKIISYSRVADTPNNMNHIYVILLIMDHVTFYYKSYQYIDWRYVRVLYIFLRKSWAYSLLVNLSFQDLNVRI